MNDENAARGAAALSSGDALSAVSAYTQALIKHPTSPDLFTQRSIALTRLKAPHKPQHELALKDAEYAVLLGQKRGRREKIQAAQQRRVIALFGLQQYGNAGFILSTMERWRSKKEADKMEGDMWKAQIDRKLKDLAEDDQARKATVKEYPDTELPSESDMKKILQAQLEADGTFSFAAESAGDSTVGGAKTEVVACEIANKSDDIPSDNIKVDHETTISTALAIPPSQTPPTNSPILAKVRHEWFQSAQNIMITIYAKGVPEGKTEIEILDDSMSLSFPHPSNPASTFVFTLDPLFALIDADASGVSIMSTKVEITLRKKVSGQRWNELEGSAPLKGKTKQEEDSAPKDPVLSEVTNTSSMKLKSTETAPSYPTSSRSGPKNWDKLAQDLTAKKKSSHKQIKKENKDKGDDSESEPEHEEDEIDSDYGGDPVDGFFKKLYSGADDDTRRAMMKSYQESGGTALSTDWKDVGKRTVEPVEEKKD
jgi:suppressor of G2 allele of SKP1